MNKYLRGFLSGLVILCMTFTSVFCSMPVFADSSRTAEEIDDRGDIDGSDDVTVNDASMLLDYVLDKGSYNGGYSDELFTYMGDVNSDKSITASDAAEILAKALDANYKFSGEKPARPTEATTEDNSEATTEDNSETTTEAVVTGEPEDAVYAGYDIVVDGRISASNEEREQPIYKTVREAVAAAPTNSTEAKPFVIGIVPGTYREPVRVNKPYITFKKITNSTSTDEEAVLTWYWLTNYTYDNIGADGDVDMSMPNKDGQNAMPNWGRSTWIQSGATGFRAENIYFENSANIYMTQEEKDANVRPVEGSGKPERANLPVGYGTSVENDVRANAYNERSCALYTEADKAVFINCTVMGTQDSLGTGGRAYFKDCYLAGRTDFICGGGQILFDNCNIHWNQSPYEQGGSILTAAQQKSNNEKGYLFYNCRVTGEPTTTSVGFGRPWGGATTETVWVNTVVDESPVNKGTPILGDTAWTDMNSAPEDARFFEYNTTCAVPSIAISTSKRRGTTNEQFTGGILDAFTVVRYNPYRYTAYKNDTYDGWDPMGVASKWQAIEEGAVVSINESYVENFKLPEAPAGYEVKYYVKSNFAQIGSDGRTVTVTRPIYGQPDADITFKAYIKKTGTIDGVEKELNTKILARTDSSGTFSLKGTISLTFAPDEDLTVKLNPVTAGGFVPLDEPKEVIIRAGEKEATYQIDNLPAAEYNLNITLSSDLYSIKGGDVQNFTGEASTDFVKNIEIGNLETMTGTAGDLTGTPSSGYTMEKVTDQEKGEVYHFKKDAGADVVATQKFVWDLAALADNIEDFKTADQVRINFSVKVPSADGWSSMLQNYFDIVGGDAKDYAASLDNTRYLRFRLGNNWQQFDVLSNTVGGFSGSSSNDVQKLNLFGKFIRGQNQGNGPTSM